MEIEQRYPILFFLDKNKFFIKNFFNEKNIAYELSPEDQRKNGFNVLFIKDEKTELWFDCEDTVYFVVFSSEKKSEELVTFDFMEYSKFISQATKLGETNFLGIDDEPLKESHYILEGKEMMITFRFLEDKLIQLFVRYDGYSRYQYERGISLHDFLINEKKQKK